MADRVAVFADNLNRPHGLIFHGNEPVVTENGQLTSLIDTDKNLSADVRTVLSQDIVGGDDHASCMQCRAQTLSFIGAWYFLKNINSLFCRVSRPLESQLADWL